MDIKLIRNEGCHIWQTAEQSLKEALQKANLPLDYEIVVVKNNEEAQKYKFFGSPQIAIDGIDIDPVATKATQFQEAGCRFYMWPAEGAARKMYEYPPMEMILAALKPDV